MNKDLLFDFNIDKAAKMVKITREFDAPQALVWDAFTKAELLDQWNAPAPMRAQTKYMDFKVGGRRFYAMIGPDGTAAGWIVQEYIAITPITHFKMYNTFADKDENRQLPGSEWDHTFSEQNGRTTVRIAIYNESLARLEKMIELGFQEALTMTLNNLQEILKLIEK
ncbi:MAG: SRPBCC family protein [Mucilaginibacter sp.]